MTFPRLKNRQREAEWMDAANVDPMQLQQSLEFIRTVNRWFGYTRATISHLKRFTAVWDRNREISILDIATGSGDVPAEILRWGDRAKLRIRIVAIDLHSLTLRTAATLNRDPRLSFAEADATRLPFPERSFDFVISSMFLHHLDEPIVLQVLKEMDRVARDGIIVADLLRRRRAMFWIRLFTLFANPMVKHDARVSVSGAFSDLEAKELIVKSGLHDLKFYCHRAHRFVLAGRRSVTNP